MCVSSDQTDPNIFLQVFIASEHQIPENESHPCCLMIIRAKMFHNPHLLLVRTVVTYYFEVNEAKLCLL